MSLETSSARLNAAAQAFGHRWHEVRAGWRDPRAERFEQRYVLATESGVRAALSAMEHMHAALEKARRECE